MLFLRLVPYGLAATLLLACAKAVTNHHNNSSLASLAGSEWGFPDKQGPFVQFKAKGEISGSGGCNNFFGTYELNGERLIIGPLASTKKACIGPAMDVEREFFGALQDAFRVDATHKTLTVYAESGDTLLSLVRKDWD